MMAAVATHSAVPLRELTVGAYRMPTDAPESDGTLEWNATTLVLVELGAGGERGVGYTYADESTATLIHAVLRGEIVGQDAMRTGALWSRMIARVRNLGRTGIAAMAISAVDVALWDLRAKLCGVSVAELLGPLRAAVPIYGSGGFTSYSTAALCRQLAGWVGDGIPRVKMKVGRDPSRDPSRVAAARQAIGADAELFVDANGAYQRKQAVALAGRFAASDVTWFEEPVYQRDFAGLAQVRAAAPAQIEIASGEYGYDAYYFAAMIAAGAVDVVQADATRCGGFTGLLAVDGLCQAQHLPLSTHCAPYLHLPAATACKQLRHIEYFHDHVRIEQAFFDDLPVPRDGTLSAASRPGIGLELKRADARRYAV